MQFVFSRWQMSRNASTHVHHNEYITMKHRVRTAQAEIIIVPFALGDSERNKFL